MNTTATGAAHEATMSSVCRPRLRVLLVEDDPADRELILRELEKGEFEITSDVAATAHEFRQKVTNKLPRCRPGRLQHGAVSRLGGAGDFAR